MKTSAISAINRAGVLLVFPIDNRREPPSLWYHLHPRSQMKWEWDEDGDHRVADLWHLRSALSTTRKVVYTKWFQGRATYFSRALFASMLRALNPEGGTAPHLGPTARKLLEILEGESPLSTKELKRMADLKGRDNEAAFQRAMKELWSSLLIVAFGEVDDGAFPSLAVGATRVLFEDLWKEAFTMDEARAVARISTALSGDSPFLRHFTQLKRSRQGARVQRGRKQGKPSRGASPKSPGGVARVVSFKDL